MIKILIGVIALLILGGFVVVGMKTNDAQDSTMEQTDSTATEETESPTMSGGATLDLSGQGLTKAPEYIFSKTNIQELNLSNNKLEGSLQAEVRHLENLRVLNLSNNSFTGVPAEVGQLSKLEVLNLANNQLTGLPIEIGNLSNLKVLDLRGNNYSEMDLKGITAKLSSSVEILVD